MAPYKVKTLPKSFENWIDPSWKYAFTDFSNLPNRAETFYFKGLGHISRFKYGWANVFDAVFYIRTMYPCKPNTDILPPPKNDGSW